MTSIRSVLIFSTLFSAFFTPVFSQQDPKETARQYMEQAELIMAETKGHGRCPRTDGDGRRP